MWGFKKNILKNSTANGNAPVTTYNFWVEGDWGNTRVRDEIDPYYSNSYNTTSYPVTDEASFRYWLKWGVSADYLAGRTAFRNLVFDISSLTDFNIVGNVVRCNIHYTVFQLDLCDLNVTDIRGLGWYERYDPNNEYQPSDNIGLYLALGNVQMEQLDLRLVSDSRGQSIEVIEYVNATRESSLLKHLFWNDKLGWFSSANDNLDSTSDLTNSAQSYRASYFTTYNSNLQIVSFRPKQAHTHYAFYNNSRLENLNIDFTDAIIGRNGLRNSVNVHGIYTSNVLTTRCPLSDFNIVGNLLVELDLRGTSLTVVPNLNVTCNDFSSIIEGQTNNVSVVLKDNLFTEQSFVDAEIWANNLPIRTTPADLFYSETTPVITTNFINILKAKGWNVWVNDIQQ